MIFDYYSLLIELVIFKCVSIIQLMIWLMIFEFSIVIEKEITELYYYWL